MNRSSWDQLRQNVLMDEKVALECDWRLTKEPSLIHVLQGLVAREKLLGQIALSKADGLLAEVLKVFPNDDGRPHRLMNSDLLERIRAHLEKTACPLS